MSAKLKAVYGSGPLHLIASILCLVVVVLAALKVIEAGNWVKIALWLVGAALVHDLLFVPLYTLLDRLAQGRRPSNAVNFLRVPAVLSGLFLLLTLGLVLERAPGTYAGATGLEPTPYLERWLVVTGVLFLVAAILYVVRARRDRTRRPSSSSTPNTAAMPNESSSAFQV